MQFTTVIPNGIGLSDPISKLFLASNTAYDTKKKKINEIELKLLNIDYEI